MKTGNWLIALAGLVLTLGGITARASEEAPAPDMETQTFGAWTMRCVTQEGAVPPCDIGQAVTNRDTGQTVMRVSFAYLADKGQYAVQILLPLGFLIPSGVLVRIEEGPDITDWPVTRCGPQGCLVEKLVAADVLDPFRAHDKGSVAVLDVQGKPIAFPLSLTGFTKAMDAMTARNKAE
ncbi:invasion associated locus B family protein [Zavarzinia compransoris]|uniref:invasion associated locus B family protein n=1 Tax=Zavarzinia marina TaxID=2911065 RepID=UPI001F18D666|nr:invasion associated locus B family protein [Zavarzinia marina]MCF4165506.1 invasion associated locus B family protein [Zavarzinia marina]